MTQAKQWSRLLAAVIFVIFGVPLGGALGHAEESTAARLPTNYRQLIAQYIRARNQYIIRDAKITAPYERFGGILRGGTISAVCVAIFRDNPFGILVRDNHVFMFEKGNLMPIGLGMESCSDLSPFIELKPR